MSLSYLLLILTILTLPVDIVQFSALNLRPWNLFAFLGFVLLLINLFKKREPIRAPFGWLFFLYLLANIVSLFNSVAISYSVIQLLKIIFIDVTLYLFIVNVINNTEILERVYKYLGLVGIYVGGFGIVQMVAAWYFHLNWMPWNYNLIGPPAWFTEKTWYGNFMVMIFAYSLILAPVFFKRRWLAVAFNLFVVFCVLISTSRSAIVAMIALLALNEASKWRDLSARKVIGRVLLLILLGGMLALMMVPQLQSSTIWSRFTAERNQDRTSVVDVAVNAIYQHPIIGNGIGTWGEAAGLSMRWPATFNIFLTALYDGGAAVFSALALMIIIFFWQTYHVLCQAKNDNSAVLLKASLFGVVSVFIVSQFHPYYLSGYAWLAIAIAAVAAYVIKKDSLKEKN